MIWFDMPSVLITSKARRPLGRLIFNMGIAIPGKTVFLIETAPWLFCIYFKVGCVVEVDVSGNSNIDDILLRCQYTMLVTGEVYFLFRT